MRKYSIVCSVLKEPRSMMELEDEVKAYSYFALSRHTTSPGRARDRQHRTQPRPTPSPHPLDQRSRLQTGRDSRYTPLILGLTRSVHRNKHLIKHHLSVISHHSQLARSLSHPLSPARLDLDKINEMMNSWHATMTMLYEQMSLIGSSVTRAQPTSRRTLHSYRGTHPTEASQPADITRGV